jgi:RNA polymerase sigma-70 factor (ECF subfamily)
MHSSGQKTKEYITKEMLEELRLGNHEIFSHIYIHYWDPLHNFIRSLIGRSEDAREMTQDIFVSLWENRQRINPDKARGIKPSIYGIARNKIMDWFDHKEVENRFERIATRGNNEELAADELTIASETEFITRLVIDEMPKMRREIFTMVTENGMSIDEVARQMQISKATVSTHLYHARSELKKVLSALLFFFY